MQIDSRVAGSSALAATALAAGAISPNAALAADMAFKAAPLPVPTWQGLYVGASVGATWLSHGSNDAASDPSIFGYGGGYGASTSGHGAGNGVGWNGGINLGYNWQDRNFVWGVEADISWLGNTSASSVGSVTTQGYTFGPFTYSGYNGSTRRTSKIEALGTARARFGIDFNGTLPYLTAGVAWGRINNTFATSVFGYAPNVVSQTSWDIGVALGGGIEHQMGPNWSIKGEILWVGFKDREIAVPTAGYGITGTGTVKFSNSVTLGKIGLNYRF